MEMNELNMLEVIYRHDYISQRDISSEVGISLGMVNLLLKKFIKVGIIKAEKLTGNKVKYILTPEGLAFFSKKTIDFVSRSYQAVKKIQIHMLEVVERNYTTGETVKIYGQHDEIGNLLYDVLKQHGYKVIWSDETPSENNYLQWSEPSGDGIYVLRMLDVDPQITDRRHANVLP